MEGVSEPSKTPVRPPQVTVAAWMIMVGSVFVVLLVWDRIAGLHSVDTRKALEPLLDDPRIQDAGIQLDDLLALIRIGSMIAAGCATAMVVLGYQTLQRSRGARLALTVLAVPLFVSGLATGGYVSSAVAAAVGTLWLGNARLWFAGKALPGGPRAAVGAPHSGTRPGWPPPYDPGPSGPSEPTSPQSGSQQPSGPPQPEQPPPMPGWAAAAPATWAPPPTSRYGVPATTAPTARPVSLVVACVLTWAFTALAAAVFAMSIVLLARNPDLILDKMHEQNPDLAAQGVSDHLILVVCYVTCAVLVLWSVVAAVLAVLAFRRMRLALYGLLVSTAGAAVFCLLGVLGSLVAVLPLGAALVTIACLVRPEVRAWFHASAGEVGGSQPS
jgi:hypothetical protein